MLFGGFENYIQIAIFLCILIIFSYIIYKNQSFSPTNINGLQRLFLWGIKFTFFFIYLIQILANNNDSKDYDLIEFFQGCQKLKHLYFNNYNHFKALMFSNMNHDFFVSNPQLDYQFTHWNSTSNFFILKLNFLFHIFSFNNIFIHHLYGTFLMFLVVMLVFKQLETLTQSKFEHYLFLSIIPFFSYYTNGITKDVLFFICIIFLINIWRFWQKSLIVKITVSLVIVAFAFQFRAIWISIFLFSCALFFLYSIKNTGLRYASIAVLMSVSIFIFNENLIEYLHFKQIEFIQNSGASSLQPLLSNNSILNILQNIPKAIWRSIFADFPFIISIANIVAAAESLSLIGIFTYIYKKSNAKNSNQMGFLFIYSILTLIIVGLTVNNIGSIVRYRGLCYFLLLFYFLITFLPKKKTLGE